MIYCTLERRVTERGANLGETKRSPNDIKAIKREIESWKKSGEKQRLVMDIIWWGSLSLPTSGGYCCPVGSIVTQRFAKKKVKYNVSSYIKEKCATNLYTVS